MSTEPKPLRRSFVVDLDVPLPSWNEVLAMPLKQRMRAKRLLREYSRLCALRCSLSAEQIETECVRSGHSMDSLRQEYCRTMEFSTSQSTLRSRIVIQTVSG